MQPSTYYKLSRLPETRHEALSWLAAQLRWERTLDRLRARRPERARRARQAA